MSAWPSKPLRELGIVVTGSTPPTSQETYFGGDVPFVTPSDLDRSDVIVQTPRTLTKSGAKIVRLIPENAVLVCCIGSLGKIGMAGRELATNQQINSVIFDTAKIWPRFGFFACQRLRTKLEAMAPATTVAIISKSKFEALEIPVPPLSEQQRIAAILDQAALVRQGREDALRRLNDLSQALFYEMFGDPSINPKHWPIGTIADLTASTQYGTSSKASEAGDYPILRMGNILPSGEWAFEELKFIDLSSNEIAKYTVRDGDILFNRTNSPDLVGKTGVYRGDKVYAFAGYLVRLRVNNHAVPEYIGSFLNSPYGKKTLRGMCKAIIGMANINAQELRTIPIALPPISLQQQFRDRVFEIQSLLPAYREHLATLNALLSSLQDRAFRGELTSKDVEHQLAIAS